MQTHKNFVLLLWLFLMIIEMAVGTDWNRVNDQVSYYLQQGAFKGGVLRVSNSTHTLYSKTFGYISNHNLPHSAPAFTNQTIFDIASLTKVTATLTCIMRLVENAMIKVDDLVTKYIPQYGNNGKETTTLRNLLLHNAGLLPDYPSPLPNTKRQVMTWVYRCALDYPLATKMVYSDLSFILLGQVAQRVTGLPLQVLSKSLMVSMGMPNSTYLPDVANFVYRIAPTEFSPYRKGLIRGQVHDPTAYLFGGVAGHAGFFSVIADLQTYMQIHLSKGLHPNGTRIYDQATVLTFSRRQDGLPYDNRRALGWDTVPIQTNPPCGHYFSANSFGHTGYTGTMMWADRQKNLIVVLLTQRVHPTSRNTLVIEARANIVDQIVKALGFL